MREIILYASISIDGYIARTNGDIDWLGNFPMSEEFDKYYKEFFNSVDTTIMGRKTYDQVNSFDTPFPYEGLDNYVFSQSKLRDTEFVTFIKDKHVEFVKELKDEDDGKNIWLIGGSQFNGLMAKNKLIDRMILSIIPKTLGRGITLFSGIRYEQNYDLIRTTSFPTGVVQLEYKLKRK